MARRRTSPIIDASATGWISMTDVFLLTTVFMAGAVLLLGVARENERDRADTEQGRATGAAARADELEAQFRDLRAVAETLKRDLRDAERELEKAQEALKRGTQEIAALEKERDRLADQLATAREEATRLAEELEILDRDSRALREKYDQVLADLEATTAERDALRASHREDAEQSKRRSLKEAKLRQELLAIRGDLDRVVFVFDRSASMDEGGRWEHVQTTAKQWINLLPVNSAALITFNDDLTVFPDDGETLLDMQDAKNRDALLVELSKLAPKGRTNTLAALRKALSYDDIDAIVLMTDGDPTVSPHKRPDDPTKDELLEEVRTFVQERAGADGFDVKIHTIGMANYFDEAFGKLLLDISKATDGTFIGR